MRARSGAHPHLFPARPPRPALAPGSLTQGPSCPEALCVLPSVLGAKSGFVHTQKGAQTPTPTQPEAQRSARAPGWEKQWTSGPAGLGPICRRMGRLRPKGERDSPQVSRAPQFLLGTHPRGQT